MPEIDIEDDEIDFSDNEFKFATSEVPNDVVTRDQHTFGYAVAQSRLAEFHEWYAAGNR